MKQDLLADQRLMKNVHQVLIILFFFSVEIISEDSVLKWYREAHSPKGKMHFLEKMRPFIEWLQNAEEGKRRSHCAIICIC